MSRASDRLSSLLTENLGAHRSRGLAGVIFIDVVLTVSMVAGLVTVALLIIRPY
jgi:hypothetical protein